MELEKLSSSKFTTLANTQLVNIAGGQPTGKGTKTLKIEEERRPNKNGGWDYYRREYVLYFLSDEFGVDECYYGSHASWNDWYWTATND